MRQPYIIREKIFTMSHLDAFREPVTFKLRNGTKTAPIEVLFSCHCWSRSPLIGEEIPSTHHVADGSKELPRHRIFCESRYELSRSLPGLIKNLLQPSHHDKVFFTRQHNVVRMEMLIPIVIGLPTIKYYVFIKLEKKEPEGEQKFIRMFVESAYSDSVMHDVPWYGKPIGFKVLLGECWEGRFPKNKL